MKNNLDIKEVSNMMSALSNYKGLPNYLSQLDPKQRDTLIAFQQRLLDKYKTEYWNEAMLRDWNSVNIHIVQQVWSNTACGWEGIGGAAISSSYTTIIENLEHFIIAVYYGGQLAYIAMIDEKMIPYRKELYRNLPGVKSLSKKDIIVIYKKR